MNAGRQDTWGYLPAVTLPLEAISGDTVSQLASITAGNVPAPVKTSTTSADAARLDRWARWGAARDGAHLTLTYRQVLGLALLALAASLLLYLDPLALLVAPLALITYVYLGAGLYKIWLLLRAREVTTPGNISSATGADDDLPVYTVLVPLNREGAMLPMLIERLARLDYPADRLEVLLLVESDDDETHDALATLNLPPHIRPITVPPGQPRTKPRALNVGLARATGEYIVIYDAEDRPEPDQLRKAVAAFRVLPRRIVCLQARLNFYNPRQTILTRLFTVDYVLWYTALLPGLTRSGGFVPLGGTSNHFRIQALRRLGGWDPFNVTEDCDLGARIARARLQVAMLDSTTWEEAVTRVPQWLRQRSRWVKGYLQSYLVHMRHPVRLLREMGPLGFIDFQALVGGTVFALLVNLLMWALTAAYVLGHGTALATFIQSLFPPAVYYPGLLCLLVGNFLFFYVNLYICVRHGYDDLTRYALLSPLYWLLMSVGAWMGFVSLLRHPHYWAKTEHGSSLAARSSVAYRSAVQTVLLDRRPADAPQLTIVIPAYNEAHRLPESLDRLRAYVDRRTTRTEIIVVDDGSTDGTGEIVNAWMERWPALRLVASQHKGKGGAIRAGVLAAQGDYIAMADADFSMPAAELERFSADALGPYDLAIGSREVEGASRLGEPWHRHVMSRGFNLVARALLVRGIRDTQCGFKCLRREAALDLCEHQTIEGWGFDVELLHIARLRGYRICEVPITWRYMPGSRVQPLRTTLAMLRDLGAIRLNSWRGRYAESQARSDEVIQTVEASWAHLSLGAAVKEDSGVSV